MDTSYRNILSELREACQRYPANIAVAEGDRVLTYQEFWLQALRVGEFVRRHAGDSPFVGLHLSKSAAYIVSLTGCWMAGKAFVPIGTDLPQARRDFIVSHADISLVLDDDTYREAVLSSPIDTVAACLPEQWAYMIYSSGTTGSPKGILVPHAGLGNLAFCQRQAFRLDSTSRYLFFLSVNFDASVSDILVTLTDGATLVIEPLTPEQLAASLLQVIEKRGVTHTDIPPSLLKMMGPKDCPDCLKTIVIGGEAADIETVRRWSSRVRLVNVYGPTEATVCTSLCVCTPQWNEPLLGDTIDNIEYSIYADGSFNAIDGELWISGIGLAVGYYKDDVLTDRKFPVVNGVRYYRTSDHVRRLEDGRLVFVGRIDRQVKYHGQLVELEEIEHVLRANRNVGKVAVVKRRVYEQSEKELLVAFVQLTDNGLQHNIVRQQLRQCCKHHLPKWMMPALFEFVDAMPVTPSGKTDLLALVRMPISMAHNVAHCQYSSEEEQAIAEVMADILKLPAMPADGDFFQNGGDSLDMILLIARLQLSGISLSPEELRTASTPRLLAQRKKANRAMCIHSSELEIEWKQPCHAPFPVMSANEDRCLITGATGFLGAHLLCELLRRELYRRVVCLVRCSSLAAGRERVEATFRRYGLDTGLLGTIDIACGDITQPLLGLPETSYKQLASEVSALYHCAAVVNMLADYQSLRETNVIGTRRVVEFCLTGKRKSLHYASTLSVFVSTDRNSGTLMERDDLSTPTNIYGGYGQTKFVAEKTVQAVSAALCDVYIYRFGLLCGDTALGISAPRDFLGMFFRGARTVGMLPYDCSRLMAVDISPIDSAVRMMADIACAGRPGTYHIASDNPLLYNRLCSIMKEEGAISSVTDYKMWLCRSLPWKDAPDVQALRMSLCRMDPELFGQVRYMDLFQTTGVKFDMTETHVLTVGRCSQDNELIKLYIRKAYETI